jgi:hypothetical protein
VKANNNQNERNNMRIPNTLREYTKAVRHNAATIYQTRYGWQIPVKDTSDIWFATKSSLKAAKAFVDMIAGEGRSHIFA